MSRVARPIQRLFPGLVARFREGRVVGACHGPDRAARRRFHGEVPSGPARGEVPLDAFETATVDYDFDLFEGPARPEAVEGLALRGNLDGVPVERGGFPRRLLERRQFGRTRTRAAFAGTAEDRADEAVRRADLNVVDLSPSSDSSSCFEKVTSAFVYVVNRILGLSFPSSRNLRRISLTRYSATVVFPVPGPPRSRVGPAAFMFQETYPS